MKVLAPTILAVALAACGGDALTVEDFFAELDRLSCERFVRCGWLAGPEACFESSDNAGFDLPATVAIAVADGSTVFDADAARACLDYERTAGCRLYEDAAEICNEVLVGTLEPGSACFLGAQCTGYCDLDLSMSCALGTCTARIAAGGACIVQPGPEILPCDDGLYCDTIDGRCTRFRELDETCTGSGAEVCDWGLFCSAGTCRPEPGLGEPCGIGAPCGEVGTYCDLSVDRCAAMVSVGEACAQDGACPIGSSCDAGICVATPPLAPLAAPCADDGDCESTLCDATALVCVEPPVCGG